MLMRFHSILFFLLKRTERTSCNGVAEHLVPRSPGPLGRQGNDVKYGVALFDLNLVNCLLKRSTNNRSVFLKFQVHYATR